jgi:hypothetical protein
MRLPIEANCDALINPSKFSKEGRVPAHVVTVVCEAPEREDHICGICGHGNGLWSITSRIINNGVACEHKLTRLGPDPDALTEPTKEEIPSCA